MPWTVADVDSHIKGLTARQKRVWVKVANSALARCVEAGGTDEKCAPSAIRQANAAAKGVRESVMDGLLEAATIKAKVQGLLRAADALLGDKELPEGIRGQVQTLRTALKKKWTDLESKDDNGKGDDEEDKKADSPAAEAARWIDEAQTVLRKAESWEATRGLIQGALREKYSGQSSGRKYDWEPWIRDFFGDTAIYEWDGKMYQIAFTVDRTGKESKVILGEPVEVEMVYIPVGEADRPKKTEDGKEFPASDYAYVPDPDKPSTWKLRLTATPGGSPDPGIVGAAAAALGKGFRGQKVQIPAADLPKVKKKVRAAWRKANPDKDDEDMPAGIKEADTQEADLELEGAFIPLVEKSVRQDGTVPLKIIQPGWGSSGYYGKDILERDGPQAFTRGTKMYWDHPTAAEAAERPERSLRDLAAELTTDAAYQETGAAGPGLYADAKVFGAYREAVNELAPHIGVSIRALGKAKSGEAEGRKGPIIERIAAAKSVDFVTSPGAGGQILQLFEAARAKVEPGSPSPLEAVTLDELKRARPDLIEGLRTEIKRSVYGDETKRKEKERMTEQEITQLKETVTALEAEKARLAEAALLREARDFVVQEIAKYDLPDLTKARLTETLAKNPVLKDGKLDTETYAAAIKDIVAAEVDYLAKVTKSGTVRGMGGSGPVGDETAREELKESFRRLYIARGKSPEEADKLAKLSVEG